MFLASDYKTFYRLARARSATAEQRSFAILQMILQPVSFLTILLIIVRVACRCSEISLPLPDGLEHWGIPILVAGAVGYLTNWVAIEMLFKPYAPTWRHGFAWITFGYWKQGLVPKNKSKIAETMGKQVAEKLLQPEKMADDLCSMVGGILQNPIVLQTIQESLQRQVVAHDQEIIDYLVPRIEAALVAEIDRLVTPDGVQTFWTEQIEPYLRSENTRNAIAEAIVAALDKRAPRLAKTVRPKIVQAIGRFVEEKAGPFLGPLLGPVADSIADYLIDRRTLEKGFREWLEDPETIPTLRSELLHYVGALREYLASPAARTKVGGFVDDIRVRFKKYLRNYLETHLSATADSLLRSEFLWRTIMDLIPRFQPELERLIRTEGMPLIIEKLAIADRIHAAVDGMDMAEFHGMINDVAAQHLGAIQVLGYFLGAIAGALTLLM